MERGQTSPLLNLPQEVRDLIYEYALTENNGRTIDDQNTSAHRRVKRQATAHERWLWSIHYPATAPHSTYLSILSCNRQLRDEIREHVTQLQKARPPTAKLLLVMAYPDLWPSWHHVPGPPDQIKTLDILVKVDHMYHPAFMTHGPHNAILTTVFEIVKRFCYLGPHLARPSVLRQPLQLITVRITMAPPVPFEEMTHVYGFPKPQLEALFREFKMLLRRMCTSGILFDAVHTFEVRVVGSEWERIFTTTKRGHEDDFAFFNGGGYRWEREESP